ncbi:MAG: MFS transporter [Bradyrhizobiaceae bacterium]|nr:MFS transporter [Bradyrhizobiaceae bacterium]
MAFGGEKRMIFILAASQALFQTISVLVMTIGGLAGYALAEDKSLATLPVAAMMVGTMAATVPASLMMGRFGRRAGFTLGATFAIAGGAFAAASLAAGWFVVLCLAHFLIGAYQGFAQFYRFAAADAASPAFRSRAISYVLAGGVVAAIVGPQIGSMTSGLSASAPFVFSYIAIVALSLLAVALATFINVPAPATDKGALPARPFAVIVRQPAFLVAVSGAAIGFGVMVLAMTATPLAMQAHHHGIGDTAFVIQWHVLGMFLPSFFTGNLIARFGAPQIMLVGIALLLGHVAIALSGVEFLHFASALILLGVGWNFTYLGGTSLLTETYRPSEKAWVQGVNDFTVFTTVVLGSFSSGVLLHLFGWTGVNLLALPLLSAAGLALIVFMLWQRRQPVPV